VFAYCEWVPRPVKPRRYAVPSRDPFIIVSKIGTTDCLPIPAYEIGVKDAVRYRRYIFLVILVDRVRSTWGHPEDAQMHKTNLNVAAFP
jgi:hypothetical protein